MFREWTAARLPADESARVSAVLAMYAPFTPLIVDPENQAGEWLRMLLMKDGLLVTHVGETNFVRDFRNSVTSGRTCAYRSCG